MKEAKICIISIGDELLLGQTINTNAAWVGEFLNSIGFNVDEVRTIHDDRQLIKNTVKDCFKKYDVIITTGGLGPTNDDMTMPVLAEFFDSEIKINEEILTKLKIFLAERNIALNGNNRNQALMPVKAQPVPNPIGTAPGLFFDEKGKYIFSLPGVPSEMKGMMRNFIAQKLQNKFQSEAIIHKMIYTQGIAESILAEKIADWENGLPNELKLAYLPEKGRVKLRLSAYGKDKKELQNKVNKAVDELVKIIPSYIYSLDKENPEEIVGNILRKHKLTIATAESCTGGNVAHKITSVSGSSGYFKGGIIAYSNEVKRNQLNVSAKDLDECGAVSKEVAEQMAKGVQKALGVDCGIATTGIAGSTGGTDEKPVGTIWIAVAIKDKTESRKYLFRSNREGNIERFTNQALILFLEKLEGLKE